MNNHRGQSGETMTWVVATIVVIVIMSIAIFVVKYSMNNRSFVPFKSTDLIITQSAISFLGYGSNFDDLKNSIAKDDYITIKPKINDFLSKISADGRWDFRVYVNDKDKGNSEIPNTPDLTKDLVSYFDFNIGGDNVTLRFGGGEDE